MLNVQRLESLIEIRRLEEQVPGLAIAIVQGQEVIYGRGFGVTSVEDGGAAVLPQTLFRIGSITKPMTAALILRLVELGELALDVPLQEYLPWLEFSEPPYAHQITLRQLLSHTSGLPSSYYPFGDRSPTALEQYIRQQLPLYQFVAPPQVAYAYSNVGFRLAGYVAEAVTGRPYPVLMQQHLFDPLHMRHTTFDTTIAMTYPLAQSHDRTPEGTLQVQHRYSDNSATYPSGGVISTVLDVAHFAIMLMNEGYFEGEQVLSPASVQLMQTPQAERYAVSQGQYGLGLALEQINAISQVGHDGLIATFTSRMTLLPAHQLAVIVMTNRGFSFWGAIDELITSVLTQLVPTYHLSPSIEVKPALLEKYLGCYRGAERGFAVISQVDGQVWLTWNGEALPMLLIRQDLYAAQRPNGEAIGVGLLPASDDYISVNSYPCQRVDTVPDYTPASLQPYVGEFEGADRLRLWIEGERLWVYSEEYASQSPCLPIAQDCFATHLGILKFTGGGLAQGLTLANHYHLKRAIP